MKRFFSLFLCAALALTLAACSPAPQESPAAAAPTGAPTAEPTAEPAPEPAAEPTAMPDMEVLSTGITDGALGLAYGAKGEQLANGIPTRSLPLTVQYIPPGRRDPGRHHDGPGRRRLGTLAFLRPGRFRQQL